MARTFALIAPVWRILQQVSCRNKTVPNAREQKEMHKNMSLGSNGVDRERSLRKILTRHRGTNFALIAPACLILHQVSCSSEMVQNAPEWKEKHKNMSLGSNGVHRERSW